MLCTILTLYTHANAWGADRVRESCDSNWRFIAQDTEGAEKAGFDDSQWRLLDVPHDWSIEGDYAKDNPTGDKCGYLPTGIGWYRKTITVAPQWKGKYVEIAFDGVFMNSEVWANGQKLGKRPYGWISFAYDITDHVANSDSITIAVRVDNKKQPSARWYTGSGIYAHTWISAKNKVHIPRDGTCIRTRQSTVEIDTELANTSGDSGSFSISTAIEDQNGVVVAETSSPIDLAAGKSSALQQQLTIPEALFWSVETPALYTAVSTVVGDGKLLDRTETRFGLRDIQWKPKTGMWINGENVKLQGVCNHIDAGALGAAVPDKVLRFRIEQLKAMGCNAIRTSHYPRTPIFYDLCDEIGMMVMDEIFDGWRKKAENDYGAHHFDQWWRRDLTDWIRRDRNHPCVVIYSVGNETHGKVGEDIVSLCHELDATRPVTSGHSGSEFMDVLGVNGGSERRGYFSDLKTDKVFIGTENTHTWQVRGFYRSQTWYRNGYPSKKQKPFETPDLTESEIFTHDWARDETRTHPKQIFNSSYDNAMVRLNARRNIQQLRDIPNYAGSFRWTGYDYIGEAGYVHGGWPFKSFMGGAIDMANFEKDLYYLYQSQWTDKPMVHILPSWTHPVMKLGTKIPVWVYSNCDEVELFLDGKSLGRQTPGKQSDKMQCQWMVGWQPGTLKAIGFKDGQQAVQAVVATAQRPSQITLSIDGEPLAETGKDIVQVRVTAQDEHDEFYPYGENRTHFHVMGPATIKALDNGSPIDVENHYRAQSRNAFYGLTRAYIEAKDQAGDIALLASCILGEKKQVTSDKVSVDVKLISLRGKIPDPKIEIYYTTDGTEPTPTASRYEGPFSVELGSTVKALITLDGKPVQQLEERFAQDEGFVWDSVKPSGPIGEQAENAKFENAAVTGTGLGFRGKGFVRFTNKPGGYIQWYQENDGDEGKTELIIRYSGRSKRKEGFEVKVEVSEDVIEEALLLPSGSKAGEDWKTVTIEIPIRRGANTIRLTPKSGKGLCIDEIRIP